MKFVIAGAGFTGVRLARRLINGKNDVTLIDNDPEITRHATNSLDCNVILADANNLQTLEEAGIAKADVLVCVTSNDEVNMITCSLVDSVYPSLLKIARVRNYAYYANSENAQEKIKNDRKLYGIDKMINPDVEACSAISIAAERGAVTEILSFENSDYEITRIVIERNSTICWKKINTIRLFTKKPIIVAYIESNGKTRLPDGETIIHEGDALGILGHRDDLGEFMELCGAKTKPLKKIAIIGAGRIGRLVAQNLIEENSASFFERFFLKSKNKKIAKEVVIIDSNEKLANLAAKQFPFTKVFCADASDESFLKEEGLTNFDLAICVTHNHEMNMVLSAYLESLGVSKTIALVETSAFAEIARKIGVDAAIPLRDSVVDSILSHLRGKSVSAVHTINDGSIEITEYELQENSFVCGKTLKEIAENGKFLVLLVKKKGEQTFSIPQGSTILTSGDNLILISDSENDSFPLKKFGIEEI